MTYRQCLRLLGLPAFPTPASVGLTVRFPREGVSWDLRRGRPVDCLAAAWWHRGQRKQHEGIRAQIEAVGTPGPEGEPFLGKGVWARALVGCWVQLKGLEDAHRAAEKVAQKYFGVSWRALRP